jgi:hypothetical protein
MSPPFVIGCTPASLRGATEPNRPPLISPPRPPLRGDCHHRRSAPRTHFPAPIGPCTAFIYSPPILASCPPPVPEAATFLLDSTKGITVHTPAIGELPKRLLSDHATSLSSPTLVSQDAESPPPKTTGAGTPPPAVSSTPHRHYTFLVSPRPQELPPPLDDALSADLIAREAANEPHRPRHRGRAVRSDHCGHGHPVPLAWVSHGP